MSFLRHDVSAHEIQFFLTTSGSGSGPGGAGPATSSTAEQITAWVTGHFRARVVDGVTVYTLH